MDFNFLYALTVLLAVNEIDGERLICASNPNCVGGGTLTVEFNCNIGGQKVKVDMLPDVYVNIKCDNVTDLDYSQLPKYSNGMNTFKSVAFKDCPLPQSSFKEVLHNMGVSKTMSLIFQNNKNISDNFQRKHFKGLNDLIKLLISVNSVSQFPENLFTDMSNLKWLNMKCKSKNISNRLLQPLENLETLEISHDKMTNITSKLFSHLSFLRKLSLWQSNVTLLSEDIFTGLTALEELDLCSNGLNELPASIFKPLNKLKTLTLFSNKFLALPQTLFSNNKLLTTVIILNNNLKLKELPNHFLANLSHLKQIHINRCGLEVLPNDLFANSSGITNISFARNEITFLPDLIFNDLINLLELDLSYNKLKCIEYHMFSSLVRLEKLNLCSNMITEIAGTTFSSLFSLIHFNMENNNLQFISSYLFSNNKQRMSISLAYNKLDFERKLLVNGSVVSAEHSPFKLTHNLKLLNLSHNEFKTSHIDWWTNGHENVDISHNSIQYLWNSEENNLSGYYEAKMKKPVKEIWLSGNILRCTCENFLFLRFVELHWKTKVVDTDLQCSIWSKRVCYTSFFVITFIIAALLFLFTIILILYYLFKKEIHLILKRIFYFTSNNSAKRNEAYNIVVKFSEQDEEFVFKEILPGLKDYKNFNVITKPICERNSKHNFFTKNMARSDLDIDIILVIFSPNYLTAVYSNVNIKKIRGEMLKAKKTVYIFVDIGIDNSIYAFLKEQRDLKTSVLWSELNYWSKLLYILLRCYDKKKNETRLKKCFENKTSLKEIRNSGTNKFSTKRSFAKLPDWPNTESLDSFAHSQV